MQPLASATEPGGRVDVGLYDTIDAEITAMVDAIKATPGPRRDIAILVRVARENGAIVQALREAHIPFEIVGLEGLLSQPEVLDLLALLEVVEDVTANPAMLRLLTGPRWRIGPRDLALLGRRAADAHRAGRHGRDDDTTLESELRRAVEGTDPTEIVSLADAVDDPGDLPYSAEARARFREISRLVSSVRAHVGEPLLDLARRGVRALDLDLELEAGDIAGGADNIALLLEAIADYSHTDRYASLSGLVAYLDAERFYAGGMEVSTPSEADSVKLLTIHRAKGLEWPTVFVPLVVGAPSSRRAADGHGGSPVPRRSPARCVATPTACRSLAEWTAAARKAYEAGRPRRRPDGGTPAGLRRVHPGGPASHRHRSLLGTHPAEAARALAVPHHHPRLARAPRHRSRSTGPIRRSRTPPTRTWSRPTASRGRRPGRASTAAARWRPTSARRSKVGSRLPRRPRPTAPSSTGWTPRSTTSSCSRSRPPRPSQDVRDVPWPSRMSATSAMALTKDPAEFARSLARPMPRRPSPAARFGTRFHAWIEDHYGMAGLFDPTDLPGRGDAGIDNDAELDRLKETFLASEFAARDAGADRGAVLARPRRSAVRRPHRRGVLHRR